MGDFCVIIYNDVRKWPILLEESDIKNVIIMKQIYKMHSAWFPSAKGMYHRGQESTAHKLSV